MSSVLQKFKCVLHFDNTERGVIMYSNITYSWLDETVRSKFKLDPSVPLNFKFSHPAFDVRMDITDDNEVNFFAEFAVTNQEMPHLYVAKAKAFEEMPSFMPNQETPTFFNFFETNTNQEMGYSGYEGNYFLNEGPSKIFESNDNEIFESGYKDEPNFTKPNSSFAFGSDDEVNDDAYDEDDVYAGKNENEKPVHNKWKNIFSLMPDVPETPLYQSKQVISNDDPIDTNIFKGKFFDTRDLLDRTIRMKSLEEGFQFLVERAEPIRYYVKCYHFNSCKWRINSRRVGDTPVFEVTSLNDNHTCDKTITYPNHRNANKKVIGHIFSEKLKDARRDLKPNDMQRDMLSNFKASISYQQAWRGKEYGLQMIRGSPTESFEMLPYYCHNLVKKTQALSHVSRQMKKAFSRCYSLPLVFL